MKFETNSDFVKFYHILRQICKGLCFIFIELKKSFNTISHSYHKEQPVIKPAYTIYTGTKVVIR